METVGDAAPSYVRMKKRAVYQYRPGSVCKTIHGQSASTVPVQMKILKLFTTWCWAIDVLPSGNSSIHEDVTWHHSKYLERHIEIHQAVRKQDGCQKCWQWISSVFELKPWESSWRIFSRVSMSSEMWSRTRHGYTIMILKRNRRAQSGIITTLLGPWSSVPLPQQAKSWLPFYGMLKVCLWLIIWRVKGLS